MPMVKGAKFNAKTGKFTMPKEYKNQKKIKEEVVKAKGPTKRRITENHRVGAKQARDSSQFAVFALYPTGRAFLAYVEQPTHDSLAAQFGGGNFQVCERDRDSGEWIGEPVPYNIDRVMYPARLPGFQTPQAPGMMGGFGFPGQGGFQFPAGPPAPNASAAEIEELEEENDDLKAELSQLRVQLAAKERELEETKRLMAEEKARSAQQQMMDSFKASLADLSNKLDGGKKDPFQQLIEFKRMEAELNGPIKPGGGLTDQLTTMLGVFDFVEKMKAKVQPNEEQGGAANGFLDVIRAVGPMIEQARAAKQDAPVVLETAAPEPEQAKQEAENRRIVEAAQPAFVSMVAKLDELYKSGAAPASFSVWFDFQDGENFAAAKAIVKVERPEGFLEVIKQLKPELLAPESTAWLVEAMTQAQAVTLK